MGEKHSNAAKYFYPYTDTTEHYYHYYHWWDKHYYDFSEFIVYVFIIPAILFVIYRRYNEKIDKFVDKLLNKK